MILLHGFEEVEIFGIVDIQEAGAAPDHEDLSDFLFDGELVERALGPLVGIAGLPDRFCLDMLFFRKGGYGHTKSDEDES